MIKRKTLLAAIFGGLLLSGGATAFAAGNDDNRAPTERRVVIPFLSTTGLYGWRVGKDNSLLLEARLNNWYKATFKGYCPPLNFESRIGVVADTMGSFDKFGKVLVDDQICYVDTLERIQTP